jgi:hypothetical protein
VPPPPCFWGEGHTRWRERGWESPNSDEGHTLWCSLYVCTLCKRVSESFTGKIIINKLSKVTIDLYEYLHFQNPVQYKLWAFATSPACEYTVFIAIMANTLSLAMKFYKQPQVNHFYYA